MKLAHNVKISVFAKDALEDTRQGLISLLPESAQLAISSGELEIDEEASEGGLTIYSVYMKRNRHCTDFLKKLFSEVDDEDMAGKICKRIDNRCRCYIRLDRKSVLEGKLVLTEGGDCYHIRVTMAVFPRKLDKAEEIICNLAKNEENQSEGP